MTDSSPPLPATDDNDTAMLAAYAFVQSMLGRADGALDFGTSPFWHGWALAEAFLAGARWRQNHGIGGQGV